MNNTPEKLTVTQTGTNVRIESNDKPVALVLWVMDYNPKQTAEKIAARYNAHEQLVSALEAKVKSCSCLGTGKFMRGCTLCGDSTFDHICNDIEKDCQQPACLAARAALALAKP